MKKNDLAYQKSITSNNNKYTVPKITIQPTLKRTISATTECFDKENVSNNIDFNWMMDQAKSKKLKKDKTLEAPVLDFSKFLESSTFKFSPLKSKFTCFDSNTIDNSTEFCFQQGKLIVIF
jgi:hypothetical protein